MLCFNGVLYANVCLRPKIECWRLVFCPVTKDNHNATYVKFLSGNQSDMEASIYTTHLNVPSKIVSEYYYRFQKNECISTRRYYVYGAPYCFCGFLYKSTTGTSKVVV